MKKLFIIVIVLMTISCSSSSDFEKGKSQLETQGYIQVENTGYNFFCCDEKDTFSTRFKCKDKSGNTVKGCFCSSPFKGVTIRFE